MEDYVGFGALNEAFAALAGKGYENVFVVASDRAWNRFNSNGIREFFSTRKTTRFADFTENPSLSDIVAGVEVYRKVRPDLLMAIGGGSPIDVAKMIKVIAHAAGTANLDAPESIVPSGEGPPLAAIATTAGSGSEATRFAVFYQGEDKRSLAHPSIRPDIAVVDPEMSSDMPPRLTAATGFDALGQAVESYWSCGATEEGMKLAEAAIGYILPNLPKAVETPCLPVRYGMAMGAYLAGKAIDFSRTTLPHALAYHITKRHGIPHGHAVALTLPYFFTLNLEPGVEILHPAGREGLERIMNRIAAMFGQGDIAGCAELWRSMMRRCGLENRLAEVGIDNRKKVEALVASVNMKRAKNHPVMPTPERLIQAFLEK